MSLSMYNLSRIAGAGYSPPLTSPSGVMGTMNSENKVFTLGATPIEPLNLMLFLNGLFQTQGIHYMLSGVTITMATAPASGGHFVAI